jgi:hypothetical protein
MKLDYTSQFAGSALPFALLPVGTFFRTAEKPDFLMRKENEKSALAWNWRDGTPTCGHYRVIEKWSMVTVVKAFKTSNGVYGFKKHVKKAKKKSKAQKTIAKVKAAERKEQKGEAAPGDGSRWDEI